MVKINEQCQEYIFEGRFPSHQCTRKAIIEESGKFYCRIHSAEYRERKRHRWEEKFARELAEADKVYHRKEVIQQVCKPFTTEWLETNTNVLKASKDMYEALKEIWVATVPKCHHGYIKTINDLCSKALAKAEGE